MTNSSGMWQSHDKFIIGLMTGCLGAAIGLVAGRSTVVENVDHEPSDEVKLLIGSMLEDDGWEAGYSWGCRYLRNQRVGIVVWEGWSEATITNTIYSNSADYDCFSKDDRVALNKTCQRAKNAIIMRCIIKAATNARKK